MKRVGNFIECRNGRIILAYNRWSLWHNFEFLPYINLNRSFLDDGINLKMGWLLFQIKIYFKNKEDKK